MAKSAPVSSPVSDTTAAVMQAVGEVQAQAVAPQQSEPAVAALRRFRVTRPDGASGVFEARDELEARAISNDHAGAWPNPSKVMVEEVIGE